jgi:hypothetical protein
MQTVPNPKFPAVGEETKDRKKRQVEPQQGTNILESSSTIFSLVLSIRVCLADLPLCWNHLSGSKEVPGCLRTMLAKT